MSSKSNSYWHLQTCSRRRLAPSVRATHSWKLNSFVNVTPEKHLLPYSYRSGNRYEWLWLQFRRLSWWSTHLVIVSVPHGKTYKSWVIYLRFHCVSTTGNHSKWSAGVMWLCLIIFLDAHVKSCYIWWYSTMEKPSFLFIIEVKL